MVGMDATGFWTNSLIVSSLLEYTPSGLVKEDVLDKI
jgi:hypothetical protein